MQTCTKMDKESFKNFIKFQIDLGLEFYSFDEKDNAVIDIDSFSAIKTINELDDFVKKHFNYEIKDIAIDIINKYKSKDKKLVAIHVRGGDYIQKSEYHKLLDKHYYDNCINQIDGNTEYVLFTDDIEYANKNFSKEVCVSELESMLK